MIYRFIDDRGTFVIKNPQNYNIYFPLTDSRGTLLSSISPKLSGDIKKDNERFLNLPASILDLKNNPLNCRDFFIKTAKDTIRLSKAYDDTLEAGPLYHKLIKKTGGLRLEITNFIPAELAVEVMRIKVKNTSKSDITFIPTSFIPLFGRSEKNLRDHRHVSSLFNRLILDKYGIILRPSMVFDEKGHALNRTNYFVLGYEGRSLAPLGQFPTLDYFFGRGDVFSPEAIAKEVKPVSRKDPDFDGKESCAAFRFRPKKLKKGEEADYYLIMGIAENSRQIKKVFSRLNSPLKFAKAFAENKKYWQSYLAGLTFDFEDSNFNNWLVWVKLQPALRKLFGCSFLPHFDYGKGGRGWRDLWQDGLGLLLSETDKAKDLILNSFKGVRLDGSNATIITEKGTFIADRNRINRVWMDHGVWPYLTSRLYLDKTADLNFLLQDQTYFRDHQFKRARETDKDFIQRDYLLRTQKGKIYRGSILEHLLIQNLVQFFNVGKHNVTRLENADWNDGLDMARDRGESAAFSFMYGHNLKDLCGFLEKLKEKKPAVLILKELVLLLDRLNKPVNYDDYRAKQKRLNEYFTKIENISGQKVEVRVRDLIRDLTAKSQASFNWLAKKQWLKEGFFNGYYDNKGRRVEGKVKNRIRMMLASQVFAIMSGVADTKQIKKTWNSINRYLKDKKSGGFRLNTDFGSVYPDLGRAFGFFYGDKENGAFFSHMNAMLAKALYKRGFVKEASAVMRSIYKMATADKAEIPPHLPEYFNNQGRGLYLYLTGSASWYIYTLMEEVLGIKFVLGDILLEPKLSGADFFRRNIEITFRLSGKKIRVIFIRAGKTSKPLKIKEVYLGQDRVFKSCLGYLIKKSSLNNKENTLKVYLS